MADEVDRTIIPGKSPCCICGKKSTYIVGTGGGFDYTTCTRHYKLMWQAFDSEDERAMTFPLCFPEGTWAGTAEGWTVAGFKLGSTTEIPEWERYVEGLPARAD